MGADLAFGEDEVSIAPSTLNPVEIDIPGDLSSAAFFMAAAAILPGSQLVVRDVGLNPTRAGFLSVLNSMGAMIMESDLTERCNEPRGNLSVNGAELLGMEVEPFRIPAMIDEVPLVAVVGTQARGVTRISGAEELHVKETDRIAAICSQLRLMGAAIQEEEGGFVVTGPSRLTGCAVDSFGDHRIAMALAVAALCASGETVISGWECVDISFPGFSSVLETLTRS
jgi:3-phosphoshikimate 1-carboxyvinyltransferase